jgi:hypothetical protein
MITGWIGAASGGSGFTEVSSAGSGTVVAGCISNIAPQREQNAASGRFSALHL